LQHHILLASLLTFKKLHCQSSTECLKNDTALACYNFDVHQPILIIFGRSVAKKVNSQMVPHLISASALPGGTEYRKLPVFT